MADTHIVKVYPEQSWHVIRMSIVMLILGGFYFLYWLMPASITSNWFFIPVAAVIFLYIFYIMYLKGAFSFTEEPLTFNYDGSVTLFYRRYYKSDITFYRYKFARKNKTYGSMVRLKNSAVGIYLVCADGLVPDPNQYQGNNTSHTNLTIDKPTLDALAKFFY